MAPPPFPKRRTRCAPCWPKPSPSPSGYPALTRAGCRAFHGHSEMFIGAFVRVALIEGFSTLISKSFSITGRLVDQGTGRLKQNNRHLSGIVIPGGLERRGAMAGCSPSASG